MTKRERRRAWRQRCRDEARTRHNREVLVLPVPCSHGPRGEHGLHVVLAPDGSVRHLSTTCSLNPPTPEENAVLTGLLGSQLQSCTSSLERFREYLAFEDSRDVSRFEYGSLLAAAADHSAHGAKQRRALNAQRHFDRVPVAVQMRAAWVRRVLENAPVPTGWNARLVDREGHIEVCVDGLAWIRIANYRGRGVYKLQAGSLDRVAHLYNPNKRPVEWSRRRVCGVCDKAVSSPRQHVKTHRHQQRTADAVLMLVEHIANNRSA